MQVDRDFTASMTFNFEGHIQPTEFVETIDVIEGVECDVFSFPNDPKKDLGIIRIKPGFMTPVQRVLDGERTVEGHISGNGQLVVKRDGGQREIYPVSDSDPDQLSVDINLGDLMQWQATADSTLWASEVCYPPYKDGRYANLLKFQAIVSAMRRAGSLDAEGNSVKSALIKLGFTGIEDVRVGFREELQVIAANHREAKALASRKADRELVNPNTHAFKVSVHLLKNNPVVL